MTNRIFSSTYVSALALTLSLCGPGSARAANPASVFPMSGAVDMEIHLDVQVTSNNGISVTIDGHESVSRGTISSSKGRGAFVAPYTPVPGNPKGSAVAISFSEIQMSNPTVRARIIAGSESSETVSWKASDGEVSLDPEIAGAPMLIHGTANKVRLFTLDKSCGGLFIIGVRSVFPTGATLELTFEEGVVEETRLVPLISANAALWTQLSAPVDTGANGAAQWTVTAAPSAKSAKIDCRLISVQQ